MHYAEARMEAIRMPRQEPVQRDRGELLEEITRSIVGLHKAFIGQGPTKARTYLTENLVVCVLQGGFTRAERTLLEHGRTQGVIDQRQALDGTLRQPMSDAVERLIERRVVGFTSAVQPDTDLSTLVFLLESTRAAPDAAVTPITAR